jgi:hypothetical protein
MSDAVITFIVSVLGSGVIAASIAARAERKHQFRERMLSVASDFSGTAMRVLAALRGYKPTKPGSRHHRNEPLLTDRNLRDKRYDRVQESFDQLRDLRGRVRLHFPGIGDQRSEVAVLADQVTGAIREATDAAERFWARCDEKPKNRKKLEERFDAEYQRARGEAWEKLLLFCNKAAATTDRRELGPTLVDRLNHRLGRGAVPSGTGTGAEPPDQQHA